MENPKPILSSDPFVRWCMLGHPEPYPHVHLQRDVEESQHYRIRTAAERAHELVDLCKDILLLGMEK